MSHTNSRTSSYLTLASHQKAIYDEVLWLLYCVLWLLYCLASPSPCQTQAVSFSSFSACLVPLLMEYCDGRILRTPVRTAEIMCDPPRLQRVPAASSRTINVYHYYHGHVGYIHAHFGDLIPTREKMKGG